MVVKVNLVGRPSGSSAVWAGASFSSAGAKLEENSWRTRGERTDGGLYSPWAARGVRTSGQGMRKGGWKGG
jgi:hypothetical protein